MSEIDKDINVPNKNDSISRRAAIDTLNDEYHGMISDESMKIYQIINWLSELPSSEAENIEEFKKNLSRAINAGIVATNTNDVYSCGMRNGMRWCRSLLEDEPPKFEKAQQWIPCSQRWPYAECGEGDTVFATCGYRDVEDTSVRWTRELYFNGGVWCYPTGEAYDQKVYAWMEKPKPWEGEENG